MIGNGFNRDGATLIITALAVSFSAWAFFHFSGEKAWLIMLIALVIALLLDNRQLRRELKTFRKSSANSD
jgi:hypothetical protein